MDLGFEATLEKFVIHIKSVHYSILFVIVDRQGKFAFTRIRKFSGQYLAAISVECY